jgi:hypothetical protein
MISLSGGSKKGNHKLALSEPSLPRLTDQAYAHIQHLAGDIGPRGSCTSAELRASEYVVSVLDGLELTEIETQEFGGSPSAYARYGVALGVAFVSQIIAGIVQTGWSYNLAAGIHALSALAIYAESDFHFNWSQWFVQPELSRNVLGSSPAREDPAHTVVITAHMDTHRTPFFNSNVTWQRIYNRGFRLIFASLILGATAAAALGLSNNPILKLLFHFLGIPFVLGMVAFIHADRTRYSPGAYDNASGVACMLSIAQWIKDNPLGRTNVWFVATGCEETGTGGMQALMNSRYAAWRDALWINLDQTGIGGLYLRLKEGLLRRYSVHPEALSLAREAAKLSGIMLRERESQAFSDAIIAFQKGLKAISLGASPSDPSQATPRHQLSDVPEHIHRKTLQDTIAYVMSLLKLWDQQEQVS